MARLSSSNWQHGEVNFFTALGFKQPFKYPQIQNQLAGAYTGSQNQNTSGSGSGSGNIAPVINKAVTAGEEAANQALGKSLARAYGWGSGDEWTALNNIVISESSWDNNAQNPGSTAYGIGQFLNTTWPTVGYQKTSDPQTQILAMLKYIKQSYGDPINAWNFHLKNGYY